MLLVPYGGDTRIITNGGIVGAATPWTAVPEGAISLDYGTVTELISAASNDQDNWGILVGVTATGAAAAASEASVDILIGGATDDVLISSLLVGYAFNSGWMSYFFPVHVPAGLRIAARLASVRTGITDPRVAVWLYGGGIPPFKSGRKVTTYGTKINNARGQAVTPTASGGAASVTQMTASTSEDHYYLLPGFQAATDTTITPAGFVNIGIGVGASTEERVGTWWFAKDANEQFTGPIPSLGAFRNVPAGSRLTLLASNSGANDTAYDGHIYAVS